MKIRAYQEIYLSKAQARLGDAFDYAVNVCQIPGKLFADLFCISSISKRMQKGDPAILLGKSGIELVIDIVRETTKKDIEIVPQERFIRTREYWIGWAVCYYQWYSDRSFYDIFEALPYEDLEIMYSTLHEADITKFIDVAEKRMHEFFPETNLKRLRSLHKYSQSELAKRSGVSLRSIQMYEQRNKDINKASAENLYRIAKVLSTDIEHLLEK